MATESTIHRVKRDPRLGAWIALMIFSIISLCAMTSRNESNNTGAEKWVISVCSISLAFAFFSCLASFTMDKFVGEKPEGLVSAFLLIIWVCGLPVIMSPKYSIAVVATADSGGLNFVSNANLYFFSWAAFACIVYICGSYARANLKQASEVISSVSATPKLAKWYLLLCTSIIVLASGAAYHRSQDCRDSDGATCNRNKYAISLGCVGTVLSLVLSCLANSGKLHIYLETASAIFMFALYTAGVAVITFENGSGTTIGNLYFSTWAGFIGSIFLLVECYHGIKEARVRGTSTNTATDDPVVKVQDNKPASADIEVEALPDSEEP